MSEFRILKQTLQSGTERFLIQKRVQSYTPFGHMFDDWVLITDRDSIDRARSVIKALEGQKVVKEEIVE